MHREYQWAGNNLRSRRDNPALALDNLTAAGAGGKVEFIPGLNCVSRNVSIRQIAEFTAGLAEINGRHGIPPPVARE
ncbi:MAG: hypothetical protein ABIH24_07585 [Verrucomicrobiota bacterium]